MSISSCPRCAKQVTLPTGVGNSAQVRCPLCHAQYALVDALANAPPLLEVIEERLEAVPADWLESAPQHQAESHGDGAEHAAPFAAEFQNEPVAHPEAAAPGGGDESIVTGPADSQAVEIEHDDFVMQEKDTEVEDFSVNTSDPLEREAHVDFEPVSAAGSDEESVFDLNAPIPSAAQPAHDESTQPVPVDGEIEIDFGDPLVIPGQSDGEDLTLDFGEPQDAAAASHETAIDFASEDSPKAPANAEDIVLDFGEPVIAGTAPAEAESPDQPAGKKKKKEKAKKKPGEPQSAAGPPRKKSLVGTLTNVVLPGVVTVPIVLYALLWLGPKYDYLNIGPKLPSFMVPAAFHKPKQVATTNQAEANEVIAKAIPQLVDAAAALGKKAGGPAAGQSPGAQPSGAPPQAEDESAAPGATTEPLPEPSAVPPADTAEPELGAPPVKPAATALAKSPAKGSATGDADEPPRTPDNEGDLPKAAAPSSKPLADEDAPDMLDKADDTAAAETSGDLDSLLDDAKPADKPAEPAEELGPLHAPAFTRSDLAKALEHTNVANQKMTAAQAANDEAKFKKARMDFYLSLYGLANVTTFVKGNAARPQLDAQRRDLEQLAMQFATDPKRLDALKGNATRWLAFSKRTTPGIVLAGMVQEVEEVGKLYHVKIQVGEAADAVVTVICGKDPQLEPDDQVFTLGSIVAHPEEELAGYDGSDTAVVWSGMTLKIPVDGK